MDIVRRKNKDTFFYVNTKTRKRVSKRIINRIKSLRIPPAYTRVRISKNASNKIQAVGIDDKDRKQYIYNKKYIERQSEIKFEELISFGKKIKRIRHDVLDNLKKCSLNKKSNISDKTCIISLILYLIDKCNFRVGNEKYKKLYNSYGVTTLNKKHFSLQDKTIKIKFKGKKGVINESKLDNLLVIDLIKELFKCNHNNHYIFCYKEGNVTHRVTEKHINDFLKKYDNSLSVKMFRTWSANYILMKKILSYPLPESNSEASKNIRSIIKEAAEQMHHTGTVSKKSYMNNKIIDLYLENPDKFKKIVDNFRNDAGNLPDVNALLNKFLQYFCLEKNNN